MPQDLVGRTFLVTGSNSGIGRAASIALAARGGRVVLAARSEERTRPVLDSIRALPGHPETMFLRLDLASLAAVRAAAEQFLATGWTLDVLVNNAGRAGGRAQSADGFELTVATNHIGPFLLTQLLLPLLRAAPQGRVVNVTSEAQQSVKELDRSWLARPPVHESGYRAYAVTKLMNVLHAKELARRESGGRVTTCALHPGVVATDIWREVPGPIRFLMKLFMTSPEKGADTMVWCATAPELAHASGRYYIARAERPPNPLADDQQLQRDLWEWTEEALAAATAERG